MVWLWRSSLHNQRKACLEGLILGCQAIYIKRLVVLIFQVYSWTLPEALTRPHRLRNRSWEKILLNGIVFNGQKSSCEIRQCWILWYRRQSILYYLHYKSKKTVMSKLFQPNRKSRDNSMIFYADPLTYFSSDGSDSIDNHSIFHFQCW